MASRDDIRRWEDELRDNELSLREAENLTEKNLALIDEWLSELEKTRADIGEDEYFNQKTLALQKRQENYALRRQENERQKDIDKARQELIRIRRQG